jgi:predicted regulator of Ras-like GTPase activity (Roadblock/LC7/MglB family)
LRNLPAFQLAGELPEIGDDNFIELPYSVIEPQLASGRVAIEPKLFHGAIPEKFRQLFVVDTAGTPVLVPLQEVLQHLPSAALKMREDQEHDEAIDQFETPFSFHAKEDQKRFGKGNLESGTPTEGDKPTATTAAEPMPVTAAPEIPKEKVSETAQAESTTAVPPVSDVNPTPEHAADVAKPSASVEVEKQPVEAKAEEKKTADQPPPAAPATVAPEKTVAEAAAKSNAKEFVLRVSCLPGVSGCSIGFADGLMMAGNLPPNLGADGLCAMAPSVLQKVEKHMPGTDLGTFTSMTLHCTKSPLSFFMQGNVCLTVLHTDQNLEPVTQEQLVEMTRELAQTFAQPETTHVDH